MRAFGPKTNASSDPELNPPLVGAGTLPLAPLAAAAAFLTSSAACPCLI